MAIVNNAITFVDTSIGNISSSWDFGDGTPHVIGKSVSHTYDKLGTYKVTDTITSPTGQTITCSQNIPILPQPNNSGFIVASAIGITFILTAYLLSKKDNIPYGTGTKG